MNNQRDRRGWAVAIPLILKTQILERAHGNSRESRMARVLSCAIAMKDDPSVGRGCAAELPRQTTSELCTLRGTTVCLLHRLPQASALAQAALWLDDRREGTENPDDAKRSVCFVLLAIQNLLVGNSNALPVLRRLQKLPSADWSFPNELAALNPRASLGDPPRRSDRVRHG
jgi:hypothetical protein